MRELNLVEMEMINGGKLETLSDWLIMGGSVCFAFCNPWIGVPAAILSATL